jgi:hypothetical protein
MARVRRQLQQRNKRACRLESAAARTPFTTSSWKRVTIAEGKSLKLLAYIVLFGSENLLSPFKAGLPT